MSGDTPPYLPPEEAENKAVHTTSIHRASRENSRTAFTQIPVNTDASNPTQFKPVVASKNSKSPTRVSPFKPKHNCRKYHTPASRQTSFNRLSTAHLEPYENDEFENHLGQVSAYKLKDKHEELKMNVRPPRISPPPLNSAFLSKVLNDKQIKLSQLQDIPFEF